jgi:hypothetical protein
MKIGFSLGRCIRDIVNGEVKTDDVEVIIAQTMCHSVSDLMRVVESYMRTPKYLKGLDPSACRGVALELWSDCKIHQPRCLGAVERLVPENAVWKEVV